MLKYLLCNKKTKSCFFCPWYRFCTGCVLDPKNDIYFGLESDKIIMVEWCRKIMTNDLNTMTTKWKESENVNKQLF